MMTANPPIGEQTLKYFRTWNCYIVFMHNKEKLISTFYNWINHFTGFLPLRATNILDARAIWMKDQRRQATKDIKDYAL